MPKFISAKQKGAVVCVYKQQAPLPAYIFIFPYASSVSAAAAFRISSLKQIASSSSCFWSTTLGASVIGQEASFTLGNAITSRMLGALLMSMIILSRPNARPP